MRGSVAQAVLCAAIVGLTAAGCRQSSSPASSAAESRGMNVAPRPQVSGTLVLDGLSAPVRIVRDRWGVPHIYAENQDDLFFAQGFVQAQDRLFQMDLW